MKTESMIGQDALARTQAPRKPSYHEIGSDFELVEDHYLGPTKLTRLPWEDSAGMFYVESGRQALALVEAELRSQRHTLLHVASYLCDSMIAPFKRTGWTLKGLQVDRDLVVDPTDLLSQVTAGALLHTPYFGRQDSPAMLAALETLQRRGVVVIVDETHRLLSGPSQVADIRVASLRKLLPVYDGGYVTSPSEQFQSRLPASSAESEIADLRQIASMSKTNALTSGDGSKTHLEMFARAERATDIRTQPATISRKSLSLLHRLNMSLIRSTRQTNSILLTQVLGRDDRFRIINQPTASLLPSHLVLDTDDVTGLRQYLIQRQIFCPVHWPPSELLPRKLDWPNHYLSLPIDQRYSEDDMTRMGESIKTYLSTKHRGRVA